MMCAIITYAIGFKGLYKLHVQRLTNNHVHDTLNASMIANITNYFFDDPSLIINATFNYTSYTTFTANGTVNMTGWINETAYNYYYNYTLYSSQSYYDYYLASKMWTYKTIFCYGCVAMIGLVWLQTLLSKTSFHRWHEYHFKEWGIVARVVIIRPAFMLIIALIPLADSSPITYIVLVGALFVFWYACERLTILHSPHHIEHTGLKFQKIEDALEALKESLHREMETGSIAKGGSGGKKKKSSSSSSSSSSS